MPKYTTNKVCKTPTENVQKRAQKAHENAQNNSKNETKHMKQIGESMHVMYVNDSTKK